MKFNNTLLFQHEKENEDFFLFDFPCDLLFEDQRNLKV